MNNESMKRDLYCEAAEKGLIPVLGERFPYPMQVELGFSSSACSAGIEELDLSVRALNCLKRANIMTTGELIGFADSDELLRIRNLGKKSYIEIRTKLLDYGYNQLSDKGKLRFWDTFLRNNNKKAQIL